MIGLKLIPKSELLMGYRTSIHSEKSKVQMPKQKIMYNSLDAHWSEKLSYMFILGTGADLKNSIGIKYCTSF